MKEGWEIKKLGDLFEITSSKRVFKAEWTTHGVPFYRAREIVKLSENGFVNNELFISEEMFKDYSKKHGIPKTNDIMVTGVGTLGICYVVKENDRFYFKDGNIIWLKSKDKINSQFVEYAFKSDFLRTQIEDSIGATVKTYTITRAKNTKIPVPPLPEQQRIVSALDRAFEAIDKAMANAEQNIINAQELFESYLQGVFGGSTGSPTKREGWEVKKVQEIARVINGFAFKSEDFSPNNTIKSIKITNVGVQEFIEEADNLLPAKYSELLKGDKVRKGNIVIALTRTIISSGLKVAVVPDSYDGALVNQRVAALVPIQNEIHYSYLYYYLTTKEVVEYVLQNVNTLMQPNLSINDLRNMPVPIPSLDIQHSIVRQLDTLQSETQKLEAIYQQKLLNLEELKKSLLQKAFAGELINEKALLV